MEGQPGEAGTISFTWPQTTSATTQTSTVNNKPTYEIPTVGSVKRPIELDDGNDKSMCATQTKRINLEVCDKVNKPVASVIPQLPSTSRELERQMKWYQRAQRIPPAEFISAFQKVQKQRAEERARSTARNAFP